MVGKLRTRKPRAAREHAATYKTPRPHLTRVEAQAVQDFRARLKEILPQGALKSLILYGSRARGDAHPGSDIDLFIVYDSAHGEKKDQIWDAAGEIALAALERDGKTILDIEPFVRTEEELQQESALGVPLLQNIAREGIVLEGENVMPEEMDRKHWVAEYMTDAKEQIDSARVLLAKGDIRRPISMAYFIYLDAARAALIAKGIAPKSHAGSLSLFGEHFVKNGRVPKKYAVHFKRRETDRLDATYEMRKQFTKEDAERALAIAEEFLAIIESLLPILLEEKP